MQIVSSCMKCQSLSSVRNKKNITNLSSAEFAHIVVKVNGANPDKVSTQKIILVTFTSKHILWVVNGITSERQFQ